MSLNQNIAGSESEVIAAIPELFAGDYPVENLIGTVATAAGSVAALTVLGKITASNKYVPCDLGASDGSEVPARILIHAADATSADVTAQMYVSGCFNIDALTWHSSFDTDAKKLAAFTSGPIFVKKNGPQVL